MGPTATRGQAGLRVDRVRRHGVVGEATTTAERTTTTSVERTATTTTTEAPTTTRRPTTSVRRTTTLPQDPLTSALTAAGFAEPTPEFRDAVETICGEFDARNADAINTVAGWTPQEQEGIRVALGVMCPGNQALVGIAVMPNGDPVFPFFPRLVDVGTIDYRVAASYEGRLVNGQVVALAPGVYTPFNPNVPDLVSYLTLPNDGDCAMRDAYFPNSGGSCWNGVQPGSAEQ